MPIAGNFMAFKARWRASMGVRIERCPRPEHRCSTFIRIICTALSKKLRAVRENAAEFSLLVMQQSWLPGWTSTAFRKRPANRCLGRELLLLAGFGGQRHKKKVHRSARAGARRICKFHGRFVATTSTLWLSNLFGARRWLTPRSYHGPHDRPSIDPSSGLRVRPSKTRRVSTKARP